MVMPGIYRSVFSDNVEIECYKEQIGGAPVWAPVSTQGLGELGESEEHTVLRDIERE